MLTTNCTHMTSFPGDAAILHRVLELKQKPGPYNRQIRHAQYERGHSSFLSPCCLAQSQASATQCGLPMKQPPLRKDVLLAARDGNLMPDWRDTEGSVLQVQGYHQGRRSPVRHQLPEQPLLPGLLLHSAPLRRVLAMCARCLTLAVLRTTRTMMGRMSTMLVERRAAR